MKIKKVIVVSAVVLALFYMISNPGGAAQTVENGFGMLQSAAESIIGFVNQVLT